MPSSPRPQLHRNRQVYTPVSAILKHVGIDKKIKRPKGWRGNKRTFWLKPEPTFRLLGAASELEAEFGILWPAVQLLRPTLGRSFGRLQADRSTAREFAYIPDTKTDEPRGVYLPPSLWPL